MGRIHLIKDCNLNIDGDVTKLEKNKTHEVPDEYLNPMPDNSGTPTNGIYIFLMDHTDSPVQMPPKVGTPEYRAFQLRRAEEQLIMERILSERAAEQVRSPKRGR